jgi:hypothetical protein
MPRLFPLRLALACALAVAALPCAPGAARTVGADLRVVTTGGKVLAEQRQYTDTVRIKTDRRADCFGAGNEGSGDTVRVAGPTALGLVVDAAQSDRDLRPISVTDAFDFGLGVCGFGGFEASGERFWYLKANHSGSQVGGDTLRVRRGDEILWYLSPGFPAPDELVLLAPGRVRAAQPFAVRVLRYDDAGERRPAAGATVPGADMPTGSDGRTTVSLSESRNLRARLAGTIPSNSVAVCIGERLSDCPAGPAQAIFGSRRADRIAGTAGPDRVSARGGNDRVDVRGGGPDRVNCGRGRDFVALSGGDVARGCERGARGRP